MLLGRGIDPQRSQSKGIEKRRWHYDAEAKSGTVPRSKGRAPWSFERQRHGITELRRARATQRMYGKGKVSPRLAKNGKGKEQLCRGKGEQCITLRGDGKARRGVTLSCDGVASSVAAMRSKGIE